MFSLVEEFLQYIVSVLCFAPDLELYEDVLDVGEDGLAVCRQLALALPPVGAEDGRASSQEVDELAQLRVRGQLARLECAYHLCGVQQVGIGLLCDFLRIRQERGALVGSHGEDDWCGVVWLVGGVVVSDNTE